MPRPDRSAERRRELSPALARAFAELGYRRATTAALAELCRVQEKSLFRLWPDKRAMFLAALEQVFVESEAVWRRLAESDDSTADAARSRGPAERLLDYETRHHGEHRLYRIIFAGLSETDDPEIRAALAALFGRFQSLIESHVRRHRAPKGGARSPEAGLAAWALVGVGTVANIGRELGVLSDRDRSRLLGIVGKRLLGDS
jgi:AcrR family transcriptional regulator